MIKISEIERILEILGIYDEIEKASHSGGGSSSGGVSTFLALSDTPNVYTANKFIRVKADGTGLEFADVVDAEGDPIWGADKPSYSTKAQADLLYATIVHNHAGVYQPVGSYLIAADLIPYRPLVPRVTTITSSATPTINTDVCDAVTITALATSITSMTSGLSGAPNNFDKLNIRIKDDGTARSITWGTSFLAGGIPLPTTTVISKVLSVYLEWDSVATVWKIKGVMQE